MPTQQPKLCRCGGVIRDGACSRCGPVKKDNHHRSAHERGYDSRWTRISKESRQLMPLCVWCWHAGRTALATSAHHIVKVRDAPQLRHDRDNVLTACDACHNTLDAMYETNRNEYDKLLKELKRVRDELLGAKA